MPPLSWGTHDRRVSIPEPRRAGKSSHLCDGRLSIKVGWARRRATGNLTGRGKKRGLREPQASGVTGLFRREMASPARSHVGGVILPRSHPPTGDHAGLAISRGAEGSIVRLPLLLLLLLLRQVLCLLQGGVVLQ